MCQVSFDHADISEASAVLVSLLQWVCFQSFYRKIRYDINLQVLHCGGITRNESSCPLGGDG